MIMIIIIIKYFEEKKRIKALFLFLFYYIFHIENKLKRNQYNKPNHIKTNTKKELKEINKN